jgi:hypothetical protein
MKHLLACASVVFAIAAVITVGGRGSPEGGPYECNHGGPPHGGPYGYERCDA